jgi:hypothetical protein
VKRWLAYFFLVIFSIQALPVKALGKYLVKRQLTEEVKGDCDGDDATDDSADDTEDDNIEGVKDFYMHHPDHNPALLNFASIKLRTSHSCEEDVPKSHVADIHCPPPNC